MLMMALTLGLELVILLALLSVAQCCIARCVSQFLHDILLLSVSCLSILIMADGHYVLLVMFLSFFSFFWPPNLGNHLADCHRILPHV